MRTSCERSARVEGLWVVVVDEGKRAEETSDAEGKGAKLELLRAPPPAATKGQTRSSLIPATKIMVIRRLDLVQVDTRTRGPL